MVHSDEDLTQLLSKADLVLTSMGANHLTSWAQMIREPLCKRLEGGNLDVILAENHPRPATAVRQALLNGANAKNVRLITENLGIAQALSLIHI